MPAACGKIIVADLNQDRLEDLAVAAPFDGKVIFFLNSGGGSFSAPQTLDAWIGARNLAAGDFDGDGVTDLAVAGPQKGLRHYRGLGDGTFTISGDLPSLDPVNQTFPKPVYVMQAVPSGDGSRDDLVVSHAESSRTWILSSNPTISPIDRVLDGSQQLNPPGIDPSFPILISEFCASNDSVIADEDGDFSDWIELHNRSDQQVQLNGWGLSDSENGEVRWLFPEISLDPGHYMVVFTSGKDRRDPDQNLHTNFKLSSAGEVLTLFKPDSDDSQTFPPLGAPRSRLSPSSPLVITDVGFGTDGELVDDNGASFDWIRIQNRSDEPVSSADWGISMTINRDNFFWTPESPITIEPETSATILFSGRNLTDGLGFVHTSFGANLLGNVLSVTDTDGKALHALDWTDVGLEFPEQIGDISFGITQSGSFRYFDFPTPGWINSAGVESLRELPAEAGAEVTFRSDGNGGRSVIAELLSEDPLLTIRYLWFCYDSATGDERHFLLNSQQTEFGIVGRTYSADLPDQYPDGGGYRIMAAAIDHGNDNEEVTLELASGGATSRAHVPVKSGGLQVSAIIPGQSARSFDIGSVLLPAAEGVMDLVSANRDTGNLEVRQGTARSGRFSHRATQIVRVPGGPRSVKIVDLDNDGWNDLIVALRNFDRVVVFKNDEGTLTLASEVPTGVSPRDIAVADFNGDGQPDAATINRLSSDISIVPAHPGTASFSKLDQIYETDGEVVGLIVTDVTGDGRDDVIQLHRASGDLSIRTAGPTGGLSQPEFIPIGTNPSAAELIDANGDGRLDIVTANLDEQGSISVRLRTATGFAPEERYTLPDEQGGGLFALEAADFNGDGILDLAAGYFDCRLALFRGTGTGTFQYTRTTRFTYESRVMTTGDFDGDGDTDLAGAGYAGDVVVFENRGDLLTDTEAPRWDYSPRSSGKFGTREITAIDFTGDGDLDLLLGSGDGAIVHRGLSGMLFERRPTAIPGTEYPTAGTLSGDFDGDGIDDIAVSCRLLSCVSILRGDGTGNFTLALVVDVPAGAYLAAGDLDGDGQADLVGAGDVLWTALSSRRSLPVASRPENNARDSHPGVVINEILAINNDVPVVSDNEKKTDWIELYNNTDATVSLDGWELELDTSDPDFPASYRFDLPAGTSLAAGKRTLIYFSPDLRSPLHTGIRLPGMGGMLTLKDASGTIADAVSYPDQQPNVAYGRYQDGANTFVFNPIPSPLGANSFDGSPDPDISFEGFDYTELRPGQPIRFHVKGKDDLGLLGITVVYQRLDVPGSPPGQFLLYDDGEHGDGAMLDGSFAGLLEPGLPPTGELQFYFVAEDLSGNVIEIPDETVFVGAGEPVRTFSFGFAGIGGPPPLRIIEVSADNKTGLEDESGGTADYVIVQNTGNSAVSLAGVSLAKEFSADENDAYAFPPGAEIGPGESFTVFADKNVKQGSRHAPFRIDRGGETLFLIGTAPLGSRFLIDRVSTPEVEEDRVLTKIGDTDLWANTLPTETRPGDVPDLWQGRAFSAAGEPVMAIAFQSQEDVDYIVEFGTGDTWKEVDRISGNGEILIVTQPGQEGTFRLTELRPPVVIPTFQNVAVTSGKTDAVISGTLATDGGDPAEITIFLGTNDGGDDSNQWEFNVEATVEDRTFNGALTGLRPGLSYTTRARATNSAGTVWSTAIAFNTLPAEAPELSNVVAARYEVDGFRIEGDSALADSVTIFYGRTDAMEVPGAWEGQIDAEFIEDGSFFAEVSGLEPGLDYFVRVRAGNAAFTSWHPSALHANTLTESENLRSNLLISEIMYHPASEGFFLEEDLEYIEIYNASRSSIDLSGLRFVGGITYDFSTADVQVLDSETYAVIVANRHAFQHRYGALDVTVLGEWLHPFRITKLSDRGETLTLQFAPTGGIIHSVTYDDRDPWPRDADGSGASLTLISMAPGQNLDSPDAWSSSVSQFGTPGIRAVAEPLILSHPADVTVEEGGTYQATVAVVGKPPLSGQWLLDGKAIGEPSEIWGSTAYLQLENLKLEDSGSLTLEVTNEFGTAGTDAATVTVIPRSKDPGSLDIDFYYADTVRASDLISLPGGDLLAVGSIDIPGGRTSIVRFTPQGVVDPSFHSPSVRGGNITTAALMDDGRIAVAGWFRRIDSIRPPGVALLFPDGRVDTSFEPKFSLNGVPHSIAPRRDGSIVVAGAFNARSDVANYNNIIRILPNGRLDASFMNELKSLVSMTDEWRYHDQGQTFGAAWRQRAFDDSEWPKGPALLYVEQSEIEGPTNTPITLTRGATTYYFRREFQNPFENEVTVDLLVSFFADDGMVAYINGEEVLRKRMPQGTIQPDTPATPKVINAREEGPFLIPRVRLKPGSNLVAVEVHQEAPGSSDVVFGMQLETPAAAGATTSLQLGTDGEVTVLKGAANGNMFIGGSFTSISGTVRRGLARLTAGGSVDESFVPAEAFSSVHAIAVQPDGKLVVSGIAGNSSKLRRFLPNGDIDPDFDPPALPTAALALALASDGAIYVALGGSGQNVLRLHPDGTADEDFAPEFITGFIERLITTADNKLAVTGQFRTVDSVPRHGIARLFGDPAESGVALQSSSDLLEWTTDNGAIIDIPAGTIHASPAVGMRRLYFRLEGIKQPAAIVPAPVGGNRFFLEVR